MLILFILYIIFRNNHIAIHENECEFLIYETTNR